MKKLISALMVVLTVMAVNPRVAKAHDEGWATVGKVLTGIAAVQLLLGCGQPVYQEARYYAPPVVYASPPVVYAPPPVVYAPAPPVVYAPPPVVYYREPLYAPPVVTYYTPPPVVFAPQCPPVYVGPPRDHRWVDRKEYHPDGKGHPDWKGRPDGDHHPDGDRRDQWK